jgi:hypothetical protein
MATKQTIEFTAKNVKAFTNWLKRFASIDNSLLLEIDEKTSQFIAKTYNIERSVVKMSKINFDDAGLTAKVSKDPKRIKAGIFNISRLIKIIDQFSDMEFNIIIDFQELISDDSNTQYAGEKIHLKNKNLRMEVDCISLSLFKYLSDQKFVEAIATTDVIGKFELSKTNIDKINSLCVLDNENKYMEFKFVDNEVFVSGKMFELSICEITSQNASINLMKEQYLDIDVENYNVELGEDRLIFKSKDSDTICVLSMCTDTE